MPVQAPVNLGMPFGIAPFAAGIECACGDGVWIAPQPGVPITLTVEFAEFQGTDNYVLWLRVRGDGTVNLEVSRPQPIYYGIYTIANDDWIWIALSFRIQGGGDGDIELSVTINGEVEIQDAIVQVVGNNPPPPLYSPPPDSNVIPDLAERWFGGQLDWVADTVEVRQEPTCTVDGEIRWYCYHCDEFLYAEILSALGHDLRDDWFVVTAPECGVHGLERRNCHRENCVYFETRTVDALTCDWGAWTPVTLPTCGVDGEDERFCTLCNTRETRTVDALTCTPCNVCSADCNKHCEPCDVCNTVCDVNCDCPTICGTCNNDPCTCNGTGNGTGTGTGGGGGPAAPPVVIVPPELPLAPFVADHVWYVRGFPDGSFRPGQSITRAEIAMILWRLLDSTAKYAERANNFSDVTTGWYARAVSYLAFRNVVTGYEDGTFRPNAPITRAELVAMMSRFFDMDENGVNNFSDVSDVHWALAYIMNASAKGWVEGFPDGTFRPSNATSRAEAVAVINRVLERVPNPETINEHLDEYVYELLGTNRLFNDITNAHWAFYHIMEAAIEHAFDLDEQNREVWTEISIPWLDLDSPRL